MKSAAKILIAAIALSGCPGEKGEKGEPGASQPCTVVDNGDGTATMTCPDGTSTTFPNSTATDGGGVQTCTVVDNGNGTATMTCPDGTSTTFANSTATDGGGVQSCTVVDNGNGTATMTCPDGTVVTFLLPTDAGTAGDSGTISDSGQGQDTAASSGVVPSGPCQGYYWSEVVEGSVDVRNTLDLNMLSGRRCITGGLALMARGISSFVALDMLEVAGGGISILNADSITSFTLPELIKAGGVVVAHSTSSLTRVSMPSLQEVLGGQFNLLNNAGLQRVEAPVLLVTDGLYLLQNPALTALYLPLLTNVYDNFYFDGNSLLPNCAIVALSEQVTLGRPGLGGFPPFIQNNDDPCQPNPCVGIEDGGSPGDAGTCAQDCAQALDYVCQ